MITCCSRDTACCPADLRQMHLQNEELVRDPTKVVELAKQRQRAIENAEEVFQTPRKQVYSGSHVTLSVLMT